MVRRSRESGVSEVSGNPRFLMGQKVSGSQRVLARGPALHQAPWVFGEGGRASEVAQLYPFLNKRVRYLLQAGRRNKDPKVAQRD